MGRFQHRKGIDILINSFIELAQDNSNLRLFLIGDQNHFVKSKGKFIPFQEWFGLLKLETHIKKRIFIFPQINNKKKLIRLLKKIKGIAVVPSRHEPFGIVNIEFMALGYILITSKGEGGDEIVNHNYDGFVSKHSKDSLKKLIEHVLIVDEKTLEKVSQNAVKKVLDLFSHQSIRKNYKQIYDTFI